MSGLSSTGSAGKPDAVVDRLEASGISGTLLQDEWSTIADADDAEASFCDAAAALGLDPYSLSEADAATLQQVEDTVGTELARDLAAVSEPARLLEDLHWMTASLVSLGRVGTADGRLLELASAMQDVEPPGGGPPWRVGYEQARVTREVLNTSARASVDLAGIVSLRRAVQGRNPALHALVGAVSASVRVVPAVGARGVSGRFIQGRALHSALRRPARPPFISAVQTWDAQVERAFAAELLAPAKGLAAELAKDGPFVSTHELDRLARHFAAPRTVVELQLQNQLQLTVAV